MRLTVAKETVLEEWCLVMYRWGSLVWLGIFKCMAATALEDRERRNTESIVLTSEVAEDLKKKGEANFRSKPMFGEQAEEKDFPRCHDCLSTWWSV